MKRANLVSLGLIGSAVVVLLALLGSSAEAASRLSDDRVVEFAALYDEGAAAEGGASLYSGLGRSSGKRRWPELVGKTFDQAQAVIKAEAPDVHVSKVVSGSAVTADYSEQRVRVFVSEQDKNTVVEVPQRG